jgi:hypothetical protein
MTDAIRFRQLERARFTPFVHSGLPRTGKRPVVRARKVCTPGDQGRKSHDGPFHVRVARGVPSLMSSLCGPRQARLLAPNDVARARLQANALATSRAVGVDGASASAPRISTRSLLDIALRFATLPATTAKTVAGVDVHAGGTRLNPVEQSPGGRVTFIREVWIQTPKLLRGQREFVRAVANMRPRRNFGRRARGNAVGRTSR